MTVPDKRLILFETLSTVAWFLMDASWMLGFKVGAIALSVVTVATCLLVMPFDEKRPSILLIDAAVTAWACMNVGWMLTDIGIWHRGQLVARVFLAIGGGLLLSALLAAYGDSQLLQAILRRFRRFRLTRRS